MAELSQAEVLEKVQTTLGRLGTGQFCYVCGLPRLSDEGRIMGWYNDGEVRDLASRDRLTPPVRAIFERLELT